MAAWAGIALALRAPDEDALYSRLATYLHPLAGRSVAWHLLNSISSIRPRPVAKLLLTGSEIGALLGEDLDIEAVMATPDSWWEGVAPEIPEGVERLLIVDAAAATLTNSLAQLVAGPTGRVLIGEHGVPLALWIDRSRVEELIEALGSGPSLADLATDLEPVTTTAAEGILIRDRIALARAGLVIRDRIVDNLLSAGVTFLLPETVLIDVDVRIGADTVIYPGVVIEGGTTIGAETVIGPGCRIIDSRIGSGVELKGWNYIVGANIRNRAVLEPYIRRGFD